MIDGTVAKEQVNRLASLRGFPTQDDPRVREAAVKELIMAMMAAADPDHARVTTDEFVHWGNGYCPVPSEIRRRLFDTEPKEPEPTPSVDAFGRCRCRGWGLTGDPPNVQFCACPAGAQLQRDIVSWEREITQGVRKDGRGPQVIERRKWTPGEWLELANGNWKPARRGYRKAGSRNGKFDMRKLPRRAQPAHGDSALLADDGEPDEQIVGALTAPASRIEPKTTADLERELASSAGPKKSREEYEREMAELQSRLADAEERLSIRDDERRARDM